METTITDGIPVLRCDPCLPPDERGISVELPGFDGMYYIPAERIAAVREEGSGYLPVAMRHEDGRAVTVILHVGYEEGGCGLNDTPGFSQTQGEESWPLVAEVVIDFLRTELPTPGVCYSHHLYCPWCSQTTYTLRDTGVRLPRQFALA